jgi:hypothetical protein
MNNSIKYILKGVAYLWLFLMAISLRAQETHRTFKFKTGEEYQTEMVTNSMAVLKRGTQVLNIGSVTSATKTYKVTLDSKLGYDFNVEIKNMDISLDALGKKLIYKSNTGFDSTSTILNALDFMLKKPINLSIDEYGIIQNSTDYKVEMATDTLVSFAGLQPETFEKGTLFGMLADITYNKLLAKGFSWTDSVTIDKQKLRTTFTIENITENNTTIKFASSIVGKLVSSNTNGTYVIDNSSGIITEKLLYSVAIGYMISAGNTVYAVSRTTSVAERTKKVK